MKLWRLASLTAVTMIMLCSCAAMRKAKASSILSDMRFSVSGWSLITATVDSNLFPKVAKAVHSPFPNPQILQMTNELLQGKTALNLGVAHVRSNITIDHPGEDTIWLGRFTGTVRLDSLMHATWKADSIYQIAPGKNQVPVFVQIPLDSRLFKILEADSMFVTGEVFAYLKQGDDEIRFEFSEKRKSPREEIRAFAENSKKTVLDALLNGWARSIM